MTSMIANPLSHIIDPCNELNSSSSLLLSVRLAFRKKRRMKSNESTVGDGLQLANVVFAMCCWSHGWGLHRQSKHTIFPLGRKCYTFSKKMDRDPHKLDITSGILVLNIFHGTYLTFAKMSITNTIKIDWFYLLFVTSFILQPTDRSYSSPLADVDTITASRCRFFA